MAGNKAAELYGEMIGGRIRELREAAGLSQRALAEASGLPYSTVRDYEQGLREPGLVRAKLIADSLGCKVDDFFPAPAKQPAGRPAKGGRKK